jgi:hypothetical protein
MIPNAGKDRLNDSEYSLSQKPKLALVQSDLYPMKDL